MLLTWDLNSIIYNGHSLIFPRVDLKTPDWCDGEVVTSLVCDDVSVSPSDISPFTAQLSPGELCTWWVTRKPPLTLSMSSCNAQVTFNTAHWSIKCGNVEYSENHRIMLRSASAYVQWLQTLLSSFFLTSVFCLPYFNTNDYSESLLSPVTVRCLIVYDWIFKF